MNSSSPPFWVLLSPHVDRVFRRIAAKDARLHERIEEQLVKLASEPNLGKPLRYSLKNQRRLHIGSLVVLYEVTGREVKVLDFDDDRIYKKYL